MLHYLLDVADPKGHYFDVRLRTQLREPVLETYGAQNHAVRLYLPAWIPGSYLIREFARNILSVQATVNHIACEVKKASKDEWLVVIPTGMVTEENILLECNWRVYAWDLSVRGAHLDQTHGFFNGTSVFLCPRGLENQGIELCISRPGQEDNTPAAPWRVACGLKWSADANGQTPALAFGCASLPAGGFVHYEADSYDALIDHPVEMGELQIAGFTAHGVPHYFVVYGADEDLDLERICQNLKPVCESQIALFEPVTKKAPFDAYWFLLHATDNGYGGLEHRNSTSLLCCRADLPQKGIEQAPKGYEGLLGLCSHEYFHSWNVKRMKPAAFVPYRLHQESYTELLWLFEGFTSYYDDVLLARAGQMDEAAYLKALGRTIAQVLKGPGRLRQTVAESSFDAWTKYYRQD